MTAEQNYVGRGTYANNIDLVDTPNPQTHQKLDDRLPFITLSLAVIRMDGETSQVEAVHDALVCYRQALGTEPANANLVRLLDDLLLELTSGMFSALDSLARPRGTELIITD